MSDIDKTKKCPVGMRSCEFNRMGYCQKDEIPEIKVVSRTQKQICTGYKIKM